MAVPAHDQRDWEFAKKYDLPIKLVIEPNDSTMSADLGKGAFVEKGKVINSGQFDGLNFDEAFDSIATYLSEQGSGTVSYTHLTLPTTPYV